MNQQGFMKENPHVRVVGDTVIASGPGRRHRAFPTAVRLPDGDILVGYREGSDHHLTLDGVFCLKRSTDNGETWSCAVTHTAVPGWDVCANIGQYPDGVMPPDEPFLHVLIRRYSWNVHPSEGQNLREAISFWSMSEDFGKNWRPQVPLYENTAAEVETDRGPMRFWGLTPHSYSSTLHRLPDGRVMGLFAGRTNLTPYRSEKGSKPSDYALAGFSDDNMRTWTYRVIADCEDGIGLTEAESVRLSNGRFVAIYGNNLGSDFFFFETHSDDEGESWSAKRRLGFRGDCPSMIQLSSGAILAVIRHYYPERTQCGVGFLVSTDGGESWGTIGDLDLTSSGDQGYPDLVKLADGRILCVYYTAPESQPISKELEEELLAAEPCHTLYADNPGVRPRAFGELQSEIRGVFLEEVSSPVRSHPVKELGRAATRSGHRGEPIEKPEL